MGDMAEIFNAMKDGWKEKRASNTEKSTAILIQKDVIFESKNNGAHLIVKSINGFIDFYPSTGLFIDRQTKKKSRGVFRLLKLARRRG